MTAAPVQGVVTRKSSYPFAETLVRFEQAIDERDLTVFVRIDHRAGARRAGLEMQEATLLIFGNPRVGTPAMLEQPLAALDLPLRVLVWEQDGQARVSYQQPEFVAARFAIPVDVPALVAALVDAASPEGLLLRDRRGFRSRRGSAARRGHG